MILKETIITNNRKTRNKNKHWTYKVVFKRIGNEDMKGKIISFEEIKAKLVKDNLFQIYKIFPPVSSCDISVCNNSPDQTEFIMEYPDVFFNSR